SEGGEPGIHNPCLWNFGFVLANTALSIGFVLASGSVGELWVRFDRLHGPGAWVRFGKVHCWRLRFGKRDCGSLGYLSPMPSQRKSETRKIRHDPKNRYDQQRVMRGHDPLLLPAIVPFLFYHMRAEIASKRCVFIDLSGKRRTLTLRPRTEERTMPE